MTDRFRVVRQMIPHAPYCTDVPYDYTWRLTPRDAIDAAPVWAGDRQPIIREIKRLRANDDPEAWRGWSPDIRIERSPWPQHTSGWAIIWAWWVRVVWSRVPGQ